MKITKEQAKIYLSLDDNKLNILDLKEIIDNRKILRAWINGAELEYKINGYPSNWERKGPIYSNWVNLTGYSYRIAKTEITVFGVKVKANPPVEKLEYNQQYFSLTSSARHGYTQDTFTDYKYERVLIKRGLCWTNKEDIIAVAKALGIYDE